MGVIELGDIRVVSEDRCKWRIMTVRNGDNS